MNTPIVHPASRPGQYHVASAARPCVVYDVNLHAGTCTCPDHLYRQRACKHILAAFDTHWEQAAEREAARRRLSIAQLKWRLMVDLVNGDATYEMKRILDGCCRILERRSVQVVEAA